MKRTIQFALMAAAICAVGCTPQNYAEKMVKVSSFRGRMDQTMIGSPANLVGKRYITSYRPAIIGDLTIQLWLISASPEITARTGGKSLGTMLLIHDIHRSNASMLSLGRRLADMGYDVVLPDLRAHGSSTGEYFTYGALEKRDLKVIMDGLLREGGIDDKIIAYGSGLGGSIAIQYAAIDPHCVGVVAYQPYVDIKAALHKDGGFVGLSDTQLDEVIKLGGDMAKFDPVEASTVASAAKLTCPLMIVRRRADMGYPDSESTAIYDASPGAKELVEIQLGGDDWTYVTGPDDYRAKLLNAFATGGLVTGYHRALAPEEPPAPPEPMVPSAPRPGSGESRPPAPTGDSTRNGDTLPPYPTLIRRTVLQ